jgi:hypothetical protein
MAYGCSDYKLDAILKCLLTLLGPNLKIKTYERTRHQILKENA